MQAQRSLTSGPWTQCSAARQTLLGSIVVVLAPLTQPSLIINLVHANPIDYQGSCNSDTAASHLLLSSSAVSSAYCPLGPGGKCYCPALPIWPLLESVHCTKSQRVLRVALR